MDQQEQSESDNKLYFYYNQGLGWVSTWDLKYALNESSSGDLIYEVGKTYIVGKTLAEVEKEGEMKP